MFAEAEADTGPQPFVAPGEPPAAPAAGGQAAGKPRSQPGGRPRTGIMVALALIAGLIGGLAGGYIGSHQGSSGTAQSYNPGPVPSPVRSRPADSVAAIAARVLPSVVMIKVNGGEGTGSGFIINGGYIVTNNHVVTLDGQDKKAPLQVVLPGGQAVPAKLVGADPYSDIAVIQPQGGSSLPPVQLGNSTGVVVGDPVIAVGSPLGLAGTVTSGIVSALHRPVQAGSGQAGGASAASEAYIDAIQTDAPINPGNSGGPLVNGQGQVIGVTSVIATLGGSSIGGQGQSGSIGLGFAIPVDQARGVIQQLIQTGKAVHPIIGAVLTGAYTGNGAEIAQSGASGGQTPITPGGPAARAGLQAGDVIVAFAGQPVHSMDDLIVDIRAHQPGDTVKITYLRHGTQHTATLVLGSSPSS
jgi:putative serine protease PepD